MLRETNDHAARSLSAQSSKVLEDVRELGAIAAEDVGKTVERLRAKGRGVARNGKARLERAKGGFEDLIATHPLRSLLVAVGVGALLGLTMRRRPAPARSVRDES